MSERRSLNPPVFCRSNCRHDRRLQAAAGRRGTISLTCQLPKNALDGCQITDAVRGVPRDFVVAFLPFLIQGRSNDTQAGTWLSAAINPAPIPAPLPLVTSRLDNTSATHFTLTLSLPAEILAAYDASASAGLYWHVILYWGSRDPFALASLPPYGEAVTLAPAARSGAVSSTILGARKNFFRTRLPDRQGWQMMGVTDNRTTGQPPYLVARGRTHFTFTDGGYSDPDASAQITAFLPPGPIMPQAGEDGRRETMEVWRPIYSSGARSGRHRFPQAMPSAA